LQAWPPGRSRRGIAATSAAVALVRRASAAPRDLERRRRGRDPDARETVVFVGTHDAAHSGLLFHPPSPRYIADHFRADRAQRHDGAGHMFPVFAGRSRWRSIRTGLRSLVRAGTSRRRERASFADIGRAPWCRANDN